MGSEKRLGKESSSTRSALIAAATKIISEEGYAAATSRRVANAAGLKPQLIHYYFDTMDDLLLDAFRRAADRAFERLEEARDSDNPMRAIWAVMSDRRGTKLMVEFKVMAMHNKAIRAEIIQYAARFRQLQIEGIERQLKGRKIDSRADPLLISVLLTSLARNIAEEGDIGFSLGHYEADAFVNECLNYCERAEMLPSSAIKDAPSNRRPRAKNGPIRQSR